MSIISAGGAVVGAGSVAAYQIQRSLRFNSADSAYLNRTPASAGNRKTFTWSGWVKRSALSSSTSYALFSTFTANNNASCNILMLTNDDLRFTAFSTLYISTTQLFRDPSSWYHIMLVADTTQATAANRLKFYVNGAQVTALTSAVYPSQNDDLALNNNTLQTIGATDEGGSINRKLDGYLTEINFIDGQALTPTSFGQTNASTGVWEPKKYAGTYGTNGFYLNFSDNASTTTLGDDLSGNGNDWTTNNFSVTAGAGNDSLVDSPTQYGTDTGAGGEVRGNYCTLNPLDKSQYSNTPTNGNLDILNALNLIEDRLVGTIAVSSGKWYFESLITGTYANCQVGIHDANSAAVTDVMYRTYDDDGEKKNPSGSVYGNTFTTGDIISVAFDMDAGKIWFAKNGTFQASGDPVAGTNAAFTDLSGTVTPFISAYAQVGDGTSGHNLNFGQRPFAYTAPSGFKALVTTNLPTPTIGATSTTQANDYFNAVLYTGNTPSTNAITGVGFAPDFVWVKSRTVADPSNLVDKVRGNNLRLKSSVTDAEVSATFTLDSDGFTVGANSESNTGSMVGWAWRANGAGSSNTAGTISSTVSVSTTSGFSIVTYTGTGSAATVGHGLGAVPRMIIVKNRDAADAWQVYHAANTANPETDYLVLNTTAATADAADRWNDTLPTSTLFSIGNGVEVNTNTEKYVAYVFAPVAGYSAFGSYTGNSSTDGPFVFTGFRPAWVMMKVTSTTNSWVIVDAARNTYNVADLSLFPNLSNAENSGSILVDFLSNGFKLRTTNANVNDSQTFVYAAFAEFPFKFSLAR